MDTVDAGAQYGELLGSFIGGFYGKTYQELIKAGIDEEKASGLASVLLNNTIDRVIKPIIGTAMQKVTEDNPFVRYLLDNPIGGKQ